jgi:hypothetical protein
MSTSLGFSISVAANLALLVVAGILFTRERPDRRATLDPAAMPVAVQPQAQANANEAAPTEIKQRANGRGLTPEVVQRFERAGISRNVLADIKRLDFRRKWNKRVVELENKYAPKQPPQREYVALERLRDAEQIRELKETLGEDGYLAWDKEETLRKLNFEEVPMNPMEADRAYELQKQLDDKLQELQMGMEDGDADLADAGTLQMQAQETYEKELEKLLGRNRYEQLKGYTSPLVEGTMMFNELNASDEQVKTLKAAQSEYSKLETAIARRLREKPSDATAIATELKALNDAREENFRNAVGAATYDQLKREHDSTYQTLKKYAAAWNLTAPEIEPVYAKVRSFQDDSERLRQAAQMSELAGQNADWNAVNSAIDKSRRETESGLQSLIGDERLRRLLRNGMLSAPGPNRRGN